MLQAKLFVLLSCYHLVENHSVKNRLREFEVHQLKLNEMVTFDKAKNRCQSMHTDGRLAAIDDQASKKKVIERITDATVSCKRFCLFIRFIKKIVMIV